MFDYLQYLSVLFLILFAIIIHLYEDKYPLENFKRLKTFKFDMVSIMISTLFVLFILDFLLNENISKNDQVENISNSEQKDIDKKSPEEKILELEDKLARTFAEMENQRRRFEKEKEEAFEYGGYAFAKEALNLIDNLERSKDILKSRNKPLINFINGIY